MRRVLLMITVALLAFSGPVRGEMSPGSRAESRGAIYGGEMMTPSEQESYRKTLWKLRTEVEKERFRRDHELRMRERARDRGIVLPGDRAPLDRPYFNDPRDEGTGELRREDGLRRWPPQRSGTPSLGPGGIQNPSTRPEERWPGRRREVEPDYRPEGLRRWPAEGTATTPSEEDDRPGTGIDSPLPPGSGRVSP